MQIIFIFAGQINFNGNAIILGSQIKPHFYFQIFPNPLRFEPERFLDDQGQLKRIEEFIPFSIGKRYFN